MWNPNPNIQPPAWEQRKFRFHPADPGKAQALTPNEAAQYNPPDPPFTPQTLKSTRANQLWNYASIHCMRGDPSGHWADIPRPTGDNVAYSFGD